MRKHRIGNRRSFRTIRRLNGRRIRWATRMLGGARRPRKPDELAIICRLTNHYLRIANRMAKAEPHLFGPQASQYFLETLAMEKERREIEADLAKVYGGTASSGRPYVDTLWSERYPEFAPRPPKS